MLGIVGLADTIICDVALVIGTPCGCVVAEAKALPAIALHSLEC